MRAVKPEVYLYSQDAEVWAKPQTLLSVGLFRYAPEFGVRTVILGPQKCAGVAGTVVQGSFRAGK